MNINIKIGITEKASAEILVFYLYEDVKKVEGALAFFDNTLNNTITELIKKREFIAKLNKITIFPTYGKIPAKRIMLVGLGKKKDVTPDKIRQAAGTTTCIIRDIGISEVTGVIDSIEIPNPSSIEWYQAYVEGCLLSLYKFQRYKNVPSEEQKKLKSLTLLVSKKECK